ncbi:unnamed protein product (macronuclear) [Paramecium tetraurelia]|uniref:Kelch motif family protein n=1 Tax=Paramecium tetraurelia TaxID=5888 RepID=A0C511_PARTE|nr:uncharacterized protein GSPATT00006377001 [Paramecium tetraurelia]CAK65878.1 unnamed protein product [Paramecium tetraurelia]|eukprot:XP_001433275.1 hypothetical protein (macronuclear) [Paramecium tetraurelia strain d4-2]
MNQDFKRTDINYSPYFEQVSLNKLKRNEYHSLQKIRDNSVRRNKLLLPSIENSTLEDISMHFNKCVTSSKSPEKQSDKLQVNKCQLEFIQQSFLELEQTKMSITMRDMSNMRNKFNCNQRIIANKEQYTVRNLERQMGSNLEDYSNLMYLQQMPTQTKNKPETNIAFFEEALNAYSYAIPSRRESAQIAVIRDKVYVFGGMSGAGLSSDLWCYDIKKQEWQLHQSDISLKVTNHSMIAWKHLLIIFGGSGYYDHKMKIRQVYSTLAYFNTQTNQWSITLESIEPRREHKAALYLGKYMVITGGLDSGEQLLNDTLMYSLDSRRWLGTKIYFDEGIAQHAICEAFDFKRNVDTIYLFGGKTKSLGSFPLMRLVFSGQAPQSWERVQGTGVAPQGRYNHTMESLNDNLILIGGRSQTIQEYQSEIVIFNLILNQWIQVKRQGLMTKRWSHCSCVFATNIFCFGGIGEVTYLPPVVFSIETDQFKIKNKMVIIKRLSTIAEDMKKQNEEYKQIKRTCRLEKFRKAQKLYEKVTTFLPLPKLKTPKMRYDIWMQFIRKILHSLNLIF